MSNKPTAERIRAIDRPVVISDYRHASDNIRFTRAADVISPQLPPCSGVTIYLADDIERLLLAVDC
jgi:hypothetical protein